jgi:signal transduction histidine kinase
MKSRIPMKRLTIRARLTLVFGGLFLLSGLLLLAVTYVLVSYQIRRGGLSGTITAASEAVPPPKDGSERGPMVGQKMVTDVADDALWTLLTQGGIALAVISAASIALGWLIAGRMLQPLQRVTETARRIANAPAADRGLHERIALDGPRDEVKELADTFDVMLERLDHSFDGQRRFIANASHELRTPLTLNRALLEVAVHRRAASTDTRQLGETLLEINSRHERLIDGLLLLSRSEQEPAERSFVDLADVAEHVASQLPPGKVTVRTETAEAPTIGNPVLLERLVQNLVENGVKHNLDSGGWVGVRTSTAPDGTAELVVTNTGPQVPRYEIPAIFEPFRRLNGERMATSGAGLGLSIVQAVARAHGGDVRAEPREGGGLTVTVTLPAPPQET